MDTFKQARGGTELMFEELTKRLSSEFLNQFSIFNYLPQADFSKTTIFWNQLSYDQDAIQFLNNPEYIEKIDHFVFVSHWQAEMFRKLYNIPGYKTHVIKNACIGIDTEKTSSDKIKICYTSTPWRGLDVLLRAWEILQPENCELHVFSSCKIYGETFGENDNQYQALYDKCHELPGVVYRGSIPNEQLRDELSNFDILAYPNTFEETSCIVVIEALSAGLRVITSNLGALPETTEGWARMYPYLMDKEKHANHFAEILEDEIKRIGDGNLDYQLDLQKRIYAPRWSWEQRIKDWIYFLEKIKPKFISRPKYFCMIDTKSSREYTYKALESFSKYTQLEPQDKFFLIDNDNNLTKDIQGVTLISNLTPRSFAQNINQILTKAIEDKADFVLLSNDIIFTPNWLPPLVNTEYITLPLCNQQITSKTNKFEIKPLMDLSEYEGNEEELNIIVNAITETDINLEQPKLIPYFCFYLPYKVSSEVGLFDEEFGKAGGEDIDYRLRADLKRYETKIITKSYLLHFMGKSTWRGNETLEETEQRNQKYYNHLIDKWGEATISKYL
jgi:glycosyltransferase involved in cell wall biosynthesis/GT2 family glycosyltransferase